MIWWPSEIPTIQYGRITLRPPTNSDVQAIYEACQDPLIPRFTTVPVGLLGEVKTITSGFKARAWSITFWSMVKSSLRATLIYFVKVLTFNFGLV